MWYLPSAPAVPASFIESAAVLMKPGIGIWLVAAAVVFVEFYAGAAGAAGVAGAGSEVLAAALF
jgi:hypothetical protein